MMPPRNLFAQTMPSRATTAHGTAIEPSPSVSGLYVQSGITQRPCRALLLLPGLLAAGHLGGCAATSSRTASDSELAMNEPSEPVLPQGRASDVVFSSPDVSRSLANVPPEFLPEYGRLDGKLNVSLGTSIYPLDAWPAPDQPSLYERRLVRVSTTADTFYLYTTRNDRRRR